MIRFPKENTAFNIVRAV